MTSDQIVKARKLTDEDISRISREATFDFRNNFDSFTKTFARAIEKAVLTLADEASSSAVREDAARYRLWRTLYTSHDADTKMPDMLVALADAWTPADVDAAIDAARAAAVPDALGAPPAGSGSTLQSPSGTSAAIPSAAVPPMRLPPMFEQVMAFGIIPERNLCPQWWQARRWSGFNRPEEAWFWVTPTDGSLKDVTQWAPIPTDEARSALVEQLTPKPPHPPAAYRTRLHRQDGAAYWSYSDTNPPPYEWEALYTAEKWGYRYE
jgi:hypothetical protein